MSSEQNNSETNLDYDKLDYIRQEEEYFLESTQDPLLTGTTSEVDNPYEIINNLLHRNWHLENRLRKIESDYKQKYEKMVEDYNENLKKYTSQIESLDTKISTIIKSKERKFGIPDTLIVEKIQEYLKQEREES